MIMLTTTAKGDQYEFSCQEIHRVKGAAKSSMSNDSTDVPSLLKFGRLCSRLGEVDAEKMSERDFTGTIFGLYSNADHKGQLDSERTRVSFNNYLVNTGNV
jgi:hypothetical protein